jgi:GntR family transcriptional repressor for pyruvate dehydrogenase complex
VTRRYRHPSPAAGEGQGERAQTRSEGVTEAIVELVRSGGYAPGARLPSERDLALRLGVSRPTVRHAIGALVQMGVLEARQGAGTVVAATGQNVFKTPFEMLVLLDRPSLEDLYEVRELVEVHLAARAAERRTNADLAAIRAALDAMRDAIREPERQTDPNVAFHEAVARAAHLPILERFMASLHDSIRAGVEATRPGVRDPAASYGIHERIYDAIARGSATDARRAMTVHMAMAVDELERADSEALGGVHD